MKVKFISLIKPKTNSQTASDNNWFLVSENETYKHYFYS